MSSLGPTRFTEREYLALERVSDTKHEFVDGAIVGMAGARPPHNVIAANMTAALVALTRGGPCVTMTSDQRVYVPATKLYAYPDVTVACGDRRYDHQEPPSLLSPTLVVEVSSDSTEDFDRGKKFLHYQAVQELVHYLIVSHRERRIDHFQRAGNGWLLTTFTEDDDSVELETLGGTVRLADVYDGVVFDEGRR